MVKSRPEILEKPRLVDSTSFYILSVFLFLARDVRALTVHGPSSAGVERSSISICCKTEYFCVMESSEIPKDSKGLLSAWVAGPDSSAVGGLVLSTKTGWSSRRPESNELYQYSDDFESYLREFLQYPTCKDVQGVASNRL